MAATKSCAILVSVSCLWFLLVGSANCQRFKPNTKFNYKFRDTIHLDDKNHFQFFDTLANHIIRREDVPYAEARLVQNLNGKASKPVNVVANYDNDLENNKIENNGLSDAPKIDSQSSSTSHATFKAESDTGFINTPDSLLTNKRYLDSIASDLIKKESAKRYLDSIASDIIKKNSDKRFLESIATEILKKESNKRYLDSIAGDLIKKNSQVGVPDYFQAGENINLPSIILQPELPFYPNEAPFPYYPSEEYDLTSFRNQNGQNYDDVFQGAGLYQNGDDYIWSDDRTSNNPKIGENMQEISKTELVQPSKTLKFNDSFDQFQSEQNGSTAPKRFLESIASEIIKKDDGENSHAGNQKRYLDDIGSSLLKRNSEDRTEEQGVQTPKRYLDQIGSNLIKRDQGVETKRMKLLKVRMFPSTHGNPKDLEAKFIARNNDFRGSQNKFKRYLDDISSSLIKKSDNGGEISEQGTNKRYLDGIASSLIKKESSKRYLDGIGGSLIKKESNKRYLDGIASSLIKKEDGATHSDDKRYLDGIASSLIKKEDGTTHSDDKRYLDGIASSLIKKESNKRYLDGIASSLIKKEDGTTHSDEKRYLDGIGSSLIKKEDDKRYLDGIASSLIKKDSNENGAENEQKRYLDGIASSLIKKESSTPEADKGSAFKSQMEGTADINVKSEDKKEAKDRGDESESELSTFREDSKDSEGEKSEKQEKRYLDGIASSLIKKDMTKAEKRYLDSIADSLVKKNKQGKRYLDGIAGSLIKKSQVKEDKRYLDGIASSLIKKQDSQKRYLDGIASSLIKKDTDHKRHFDGIASSLIKKEVNGQKRYFDGISSSLIKKKDNVQGNHDSSKRYLDEIASSLVKKEIVSSKNKRYLDDIGNSLIKKDDDTVQNKRYFDDIGSSLVKKEKSEKRYLDGIASSLIKKSAGEKRYLDSIAGTLIKKESHPAQQVNQARILKRKFEVTDDVMDGSRENHDLERRSVGSSKIDDDLLKSDTSKVRRKRDVSIMPFRDLKSPSMSKLSSRRRRKRFIDNIASDIVYKRFGSSMGNPQQEDPLEEYENFMDHQQNIRNQRLRGDKNDLQGLHIFSDTEEDTSTNMPPEVENPSNFDSRITGMFWNFNQGDQDSNTPTQPLSSQLARPDSYLYSQVLYPLLPNVKNQEPTGLVSQNDISVFPSEKPNLESQRTALDVDSNPESYKSIGNRDTLSFARAIASPYIDENGAEFFKNNNVFKQPQLDPMASSAFRKHYLDTLASDLVNLLEQDTREPTRGYNTNGKVLILDPYEQASRGKRFIDSLASDLLYKRKYWRQANPMSINSEPARYSSNVNYPRLSIRGRLRTFQSKSAPKGKKLSTAATSWRGRPTLMTAMLATGKGPNDEDTKVYLRHAMKDYVRDVSKKVLARAKIIGEKLHRAPLARSNDVVQPRGNKYYWKQGDNHSTRRDFFDSLAGDLLT